MCDHAYLHSPSQASAQVHLELQEMTLQVRSSGEGLFFFDRLYLDNTEAFPRLFIEVEMWPSFCKISNNCLQGQGSMKLFW